MDDHIDLNLCTSIVSDIPRESVRELLELAETAPIEIVSSSQEGLTIRQVLDVFDSEFGLSEVLDTKAEVTLEGRRGFAMIPGDEPERSLAQACIKVLLASDDLKLKARAEKLLQREWDDNKRGVLYSAC